MLLATKVNSVARMLGIPTVSTFTPHDLLSKAHGEEASLVIIDLDEEHLHPLESVSQIKKDKHTKSIVIIGFHSKTDDIKLKTAKESGCDIVLGKSQFIESLEDILTGKITRSRPSE
jgi:PleD family two-component response regulator